MKNDEMFDLIDSDETIDDDLNDDELFDLNDGIMIEVPLADTGDFEKKMNISNYAKLAEGYSVSIFEVKGVSADELKKMFPTSVILSAKDMMTRRQKR